MAEKLQAMLPWTSKPLLCNGPMRGFALHALACAVSGAGGLGLIGATSDMQHLSGELDKARAALSGVPGPDGRLPLGVGLLTCFTDRAAALEVLAKHRPAVVWLFAAPDIAGYAGWAEEVRRACGAAVWIQTGSVRDALTISRTAAPDVLVLQGADAGGHGLEQSAGLMALVPEAADALAKEGFGATPLLAAGGIVDARGVAAAHALGASGVVMGTRFLASEEVVVPHRAYVEELLAAEDGGAATVRSKVFDDLNLKGNIWPGPYDGRALRNMTYKDAVAGMDIEENRRLHQEALKQPGKGFEAQEKRVTVWAGSGVGLVRDVRKGAAIVEETRVAAQKLLRALPAKM